MEKKNINYKYFKDKCESLSTIDFNKTTVHCGKYTVIRVDRKPDLHEQISVMLTSVFTVVTLMHFYNELVDNSFCGWKTLFGETSVSCLQMHTRY